MSRSLVFLSYRGFHHSCAVHKVLRKRPDTSLRIHLFDFDAPTVSVIAMMYNNHH